jgi:hypothetical protein
MKSEVVTRDELPYHTTDVIARKKQRQDTLYPVQTSNTPCPHASCKVL